MPQSLDKENQPSFLRAFATVVKSGVTKGFDVVTSILSPGSKRKRSQSGESSQGDDADFRPTAKQRTSNYSQSDPSVYTQQGHTEVAHLLPGTSNGAVPHVHQPQLSAPNVQHQPQQLSSTGGLRDRFNFIKESLDIAGPSVPGRLSSTSGPVEMPPPQATHQQQQQLQQQALYPPPQCEIAPAAGPAHTGSLHHNQPESTLKPRQLELSLAATPAQSSKPGGLFSSELQNLTARSKGPQHLPAPSSSGLARPTFGWSSKPPTHSTIGMPAVYSRLPFQSAGKGRQHLVMPSTNAPRSSLFPAPPVPRPTDATTYLAMLMDARKQEQERFQMRAAMPPVPITLPGPVVDLTEVDELESHAQSLKARIQGNNEEAQKKSTAARMKIFTTLSSTSMSAAQEQAASLQDQALHAQAEYRALEGKVRQRDRLALERRAEHERRMVEIKAQEPVVPVFIKPLPLARPAEPAPAAAAAAAKGRRAPAPAAPAPAAAGKKKAAPRPPAEDEVILLSSDEEEEQEEEEAEEEAEAEAAAGAPGPERRVLSDADQQVWELVMDRRRNPREKLVVHERSNIEITRDKLWCLAPNQWLNDEVINVYMALLLERDVRQRKPGSPAPKCHFFSSFFLNKLYKDEARYNYKNVRRWTTPMRLKGGGQTADCLLDLDRIIMPVNCGNMHWTTAMIDLKNKQLVYMDSFHAADPLLLDHLAAWVSDEAKDKRPQSQGQWDASQWPRINALDVPRQQNGVDCGVFSCKFADYCGLARPFDFSQADMEYFRRKMLCQIMAKRVD